MPQPRNVRVILFIFTAASTQAEWTHPPKHMCGDASADANDMQYLHDAMGWFRIQKTGCTRLYTGTHNSYSRNRNWNLYINSFWFQSSALAARVFIGCRSAFYHRRICSTHYVCFDELADLLRDLNLCYKCNSWKKLAAFPFKNICLKSAFISNKANKVWY